MEVYGDSKNNIVRRGKLARLSEDTPDYRILYVQAPAGYGKTVFGSQWLMERNGPKAEIVLDEYDNTAGNLCRKLKIILDNLNSGDCSASLLTNGREFDLAPVDLLMGMASDMPPDSKGAVVIDDLHYLKDYEMQKVLGTFLMRLPEGIKVCILSRNDPPESFSGLILKNRLKFISGDEMLFDINEIYALYKDRNVAITKRQSEEVLAFTEGWPIGINALLLSGNPIPEGSMEKNRLESFLRTEVWCTWDEKSREFMIATCMEEELSKGLCDALTGCPESGKMLGDLQSAGAFLYREQNGNYRFHRLFREFLKTMFHKKPKEYCDGQIRTAGNWYLKQKDFYHAVEKFSCIKDYERLAECFDLLEEIDRTGFDAAQVMQAVHEILNEEIVEQYPYLFFMMAFTARNDGRIDEFTYYADQYYNRYPQIIERNPELAHNIFFLYAMDFRISLADIAGMAGDSQVSGSFAGVRGTATSYFPFYHRSYRDFSELIPGDIDQETEILRRTLGALLGDECNMIVQCIRAGLYYEKGELPKAQDAALLAASELQSGFASESKFCVLVLLMTIHHAMYQTKQEQMVQKDIERMIETDKAFYLNYNFEAVICRNSLDSGNRDAAERWLETRGSAIYDQVDFFRLYGHFTTVRAHIALGNFNHAIILLKKVLHMCGSMKRTSDVIEAEVLLAIAFWKKKRGNRKTALSYLEEAVRSACPLGFEQIFINEGAELENMLSNLKNRTARSDYDGDLSEVFVRKLYIGAAEQARHRKGLTGGRVETGEKFTPRQKRVMKLMCEGHSYKSIAQELGIQFSTVRSHIELIYRKLDVSDMKEAVLKIRQLHILEDI